MSIEAPDKPIPTQETNDGKKQESADLPPRSVEDLEKENRERKGRQEERNSQETTEQKQGENGAEQLLENEIMNQLFQEMREGLKGDAKTVFAAIEAQISPKEKVDLAKSFHDFQEIADQNHANANQHLHGIPRDEYMRTARLHRSTKVAQTFQNSVDQFFEKKLAPKTSTQQLNEQLNTKSNNEADAALSADGQRAWQKVGGLIAQYVSDHPEKQFSPQQKPPASQGRVDERSERMTKRMSEVYAAQNLLFEIDQAKQSGITVKLRNQTTGQEVTSVEEIANTTPGVDVVIEGLKDVQQAQRFMEGARAITTEKQANGATFRGTTTELRDGLDQLVKSIKKQKEQNRA